LYGIDIVAESVEVEVEQDDGVQAELGVEALEVSSEEVIMAGSCFDLFKPGAAEAGASYALLKVLRAVGETALSVSSRKLEPFPKVRS
jgi:hypothetical protein